MSVIVYPLAMLPSKPVIDRLIDIEQYHS